MLQPEELTRAMGFLPDYQFPDGVRRDKIRLLGNGVCPPVMEALVSHLTLISRSENIAA
jgi:DNA (cytosine-5)-methyltransferase 1